MRVLFFTFTFLLTFMSYSQTKLTFDYDAAGNQVSRILCINCLSTSRKEIKEVELIAADDLQQFFDNDVISYYPNPVREELYLQWQLADDNYVTLIHVYSLTGQVLRTYQGNAMMNNLNIPFQSYPTGVYLVLLSYKDGGEKSIKIIKQ